LNADARNEFLGHLLENGGQHAQPTLAAAGAQVSHSAAELAQNGQSAEAQLPTGAKAGSAAASATKSDQDMETGQDLGVQEQALGIDTSRAQSAEPDQDAAAQHEKYSAEPSGAQLMDLDEAPESRSHLPRPGSGRRPKYVTPVDELDNSDVESAQVRTLQTFPSLLSPQYSAQRIACQEPMSVCKMSNTAELHEGQAQLILLRQEGCDCTLGCALAVALDHTI